MDDMIEELMEKHQPHVQVADDEDEAPPPQARHEGAPPSRQASPPARNEGVPRPHPPVRTAPPQLHVSRPPRPTQQVPHPNPDPPQAPVSSGGWAISREMLREKYGFFFGIIGIGCAANSFFTTFIGVSFLWNLAFDARPIYCTIAGIVAIVLLFAGQVWNADFDADGVVNKNQKWSYWFWLFPDAQFTLWFYIVPITKILTFIFFGSRAPAESVRDAGLLIRTAFAHSTISGLVYVLCLLTAVVFSCAWGVASAYYPEKALLGPRTREKIRNAIRTVGQQLHQ